MILDVPKFTAGDPGEPEIYFWSESEDSESLYSKFHSKGRKRSMPQLRQAGRQSKFIPAQYFCSNQSFSWLDEAEPR